MLIEASSEEELSLGQSQQMGILPLLSLPGRSSRVYSVRAEQGRRKTSLVHLRKAPSISSSQHKPQLSLCGDGMGNSPLMHTDALHLPLSHCMLAWPVHADPAAGGQGALDGGGTDVAWGQTKEGPGAPHAHHWGCAQVFGPSAAGLGLPMD